MKSAYELAMERLASEDPDTKPLSDEQKVEIGEIDTKYKAKVAERKIFLEKALGEALENNDTVQAEKIRAQIAEEVASLEQEAERAKEKIRAG